jgi:peptidoglycan/LPS O-acetylase OafA/YrhL
LVGSQTVPATLLTGGTHSKSRNAGIDLLRGIAIVLVIFHHIGIRLPLAQTMLKPWLPKWILGLLNFRGYQAVFLFFVLSGFLIARQSITRWGSLRHRHLRAFYVRRAARILPCLLLLLAVLSLLHWSGLGDYKIAGPGQSLGHALLSALGLHLNWYEGLTGYLPANWDVLWSLSIEESFYLAFPLLCLLLARDWLLAPALGIFALALPYWIATTQGSEIWQDKAYLPGFSAIALGVLGAMITRWWTQPPRWLVYLLCGFGTAGLIGIFCALAKIWPLLHEGSMLLLTISAMALVLGFHWQAATGPAWTLPGSKWLRSCGSTSYEIYLTHMFVILPVYHLFRYFNPKDSYWAWTVYLPILALCWLLGWLVARYLSTPADRWLRSRFLPCPPKV